MSAFGLVYLELEDYFVLKMDVFVEVKFIIRILFFLTLCSMIEVEAVSFDCIKSDECSCKTNTSVTKQEISLWSLPSREKVESALGNDVFAITLCHGFNIHPDAPSGGCRNSTVCQYNPNSKDETFEIGRFGTVTFGQYNNDSKTIILQYSGTSLKGVTRSINITMICDENGNITKPVYHDVKRSPIYLNAFTTRIETKAACLLPEVVPYPTTHDNITGSGGLKTFHYVLIAFGIVILFLVLCVVVYMRKRKRGLLTEMEENEDYGTVPRAHVQNALSTPGSGPV